MTVMRLALPRRLRLGLALALVVAISGCLTPEQHLERVDQQAYEDIGAVQDVVLGGRRPFTVVTPTGRLAVVDVNPMTGLTVPGRKIAISLADALAVAAWNSRTFQQNKEALFGAALSLQNFRHDFAPQPFWNFGGNAASVSRSQSTGSDTNFGFSRLLEQGGSYTVSVGLSAFTFLTNPRLESLISLLDVSISLPFLRNAGREIVIENLRQSERDLLYALRDFERFKQTYGVQVIAAYMRLLSRERQITNGEANLRTLEYALNRNQAYLDEGRIRRIEVDQAEQSWLRGQNSLVLARQRFEQDLDSFKNLIGIPVDLPVDVRIEDLLELETLIQEGVSIAEESAMAAALRARLDYRNAVDGVADAGRKVEVAKNQLKPNVLLMLGLGADSDRNRLLHYNFADGSYSAALDIDLALDRVDEAVSFRSSLISLQSALRSQEAFRESVKLEVRNALRNLAQARKTYEINLKAVELAEARVESTLELLLVDKADTRDFLESQDALISNQNEMVSSLVEYRIAWLELLRDTGALVVSGEGLDHAASMGIFHES